MRYLNRNIDPLALWGHYVDFPPHMDDSGEFTPLLFCPNPSHFNDRSPAFQINLQRPLCHCFSGCGISGSYLDAIMLIEGCDKREARKIIIGKAVTKFPHTALPKIQEKVKKKAVIDLEGELKNYSFLPSEALDYLKGRGIGPSEISKWQIGYDPESQRLTLPAYDLRGRLRFFVKRGIHPEQHPRYLYPEDAAKTALLYGLDRADKSLIRSEGLVVVEGPFDAIFVQKAGLTNSCALLGSYLSQDQQNAVFKVRPPKVFAFVDRDVGGTNALRSISEWLFKYPIYVMLYPKNKYDPAECTEDEIRRSYREAVTIHKFNKLAGESEGRITGRRGQGVTS